MSVFYQTVVTFGYHQEEGPALRPWTIGRLDCHLFSLCFLISVGATLIYHLMRETEAKGYRRSAKKTV